ncbi:MAG TPA: hypothetical protein VFR84_18010 [Candidatus Angelobacter sp.]|nr:hypothetical protein [Candidatus Angelobacter sp.]
MRTRRLGLILSLAIAMCATAAFAQTGAAPKTGKNSAAQNQILQRGRDAYYSLRAQGLDQFQSTIKPNWENVLKGQGVGDPAQLEAALKLLNGLHFTMVLDKEGKVSVSHTSDNEPPNEQVRAGFNQIYSGIEQAVSGFFATWSLFMLTPPLPEVNSDYQLDDLGTTYRLTYKDGTSDVVTILARDMSISEVKVTTAQFSSTVRPRMSKTAKGFVLAGYDADYTPTSGPGVVHLDVKIAHAPVQGLQLPVSLIADTTLDGAPTHIELAFSDHQVKSH